jgi:hypothetical protein
MDLRLTFTVGVTSPRYVLSFFMQQTELAGVLHAGDLVVHPVNSEISLITSFALVKLVKVAY